ncbi:MAG: hypothetical protein LBT90_03420 [Holosporaceae bacterium]|nr:hypothetical protein [Holosporaceae bacterium]
MYSKRKFYIKTLVIVLIAIAIAMAFLLLKPIMEGTKKAAMGDFLNHIGDESSFRNFSYTMHTKDKKEITLESDKVTEIEKNRYVFENLKSTFTLSNGDVVTILANTTKTRNGSKTKCELGGNVRLFTKSGLYMQTEKVFVDFDKKIVRGDGAIAMELSTNTNYKKKTTLKGEFFCFDFDKNILTISRAAKGNVDSNAISAGGITIYFDNIKERTVKKIDATKNPIFVTKYYTITAKNAMTYSSKKIHADGDVVFTYHNGNKNMRVKSNDFTAIVDGNGNVSSIVANSAFTAYTANAIIEADGGCLAGNQISAFGNVVVISKNGNIFGESAVFDISSGEVQLKKSSGVVMAEDPFNRFITK